MKIKIADSSYVQEPIITLHLVTEDGNTTVQASSSENNDGEPWVIVRFFESNGKLVMELASGIDDLLIATDSTGCIKHITDF